MSDTTVERDARSRRGSSGDQTALVGTAFCLLTTVLLQDCSCSHPQSTGVARSTRMMSRSADKGLPLGHPRSVPDVSQWTSLASLLKPAVADGARLLDVALDSAATFDLASHLAPLMGDRAAEPPCDSDWQAFANSQNGPFDDLILAASRRWRIDPFLLKGLLANESSLEPLAVGKRVFKRIAGKRRVVSGGAVGIAQFSQAGIRAIRRLRRRRGRRQLVLGFDRARARVPAEAIFAAAELLNHLIERYGRDGGITAYNSGVVGGIAVRRLGFWKARRAGKLHRSGIHPIQGHRFLLNVLRWANRFRMHAGIETLSLPEDDSRGPVQDALALL